MTSHPTSRRRLLIGAASAVALPGLLAQRLARAAALRPTPSQTEGPFYPVEIPADHDADLLRNGQVRYAKGDAVWVEGTVLDLDGRALQGGVVEIWQCDSDGHYHHPGDGGRADPAFQGFGRIAVDREGRYRFRTIRPVAYTGRTPHIHVKVRLDTAELLTTQLYVQGDPGNDRDGIWRRLSEADRAAVTVPFQRVSDGLRAVFPIVVRA
ncbi:MAG: intradiol ring-cleavage dioxygenase [Hydrogenophaga sp.]|uniref:protocatechuate 3,4-dioxygenase n=1 Tax=Hydrogenophaga sp. TaxID=1904254 RepID=UPI001D9E5C30|nr:protocatechuate 3,4-dioxygenase [Hydrogenophaga sp.]MBX3608811.1 intradiol ring-cleavage dioxygenase [Hydrogenophaga sp.]